MARAHAVLALALVAAVQSASAQVPLVPPCIWIRPAPVPTPHAPRRGGLARPPPEHKHANSRAGRGLLPICAHPHA